MKISLSFVALVASANATFSPLVDVDTRSLDEIYAAAKKDNGTLQVFWGGDAGAAGDEVRTSFAKRFPDVKINLTVELSKYHDNQIDRGWYEGKHVADVAWLQTTHNYPRWKQEGKLVNYKPPTFNDILNGEKDFDGAWMAASLFGFGQMVYDSTKINASEVPTSYASITDPKFKGKLILTYPNDDDAIAYLFSLIIGRYGYDWLYALAKNDVQWVRGTYTPAALLTQGHNTTSKRSLSFMAYNLGVPFLLSKDIEAPEQKISWVQDIAIIKGTKMLELAKLLVAWLTSVERQSEPNYFGFASVLDSVNRKNGLTPYQQNNTQVTGFRSWELNRANVEFWNNTYEEVLGTPQGLGPLQMFPNAA